MVSQFAMAKVKVTVKVMLFFSNNCCYHETTFLSISDGCIEQDMSKIALSCMNKCIPCGSLGSFALADLVVGSFIFLMVNLTISAWSGGTIRG